MPITCYAAPGLDLYVLFDDDDDTAVDMTEGSSLKAGRYTVADSAIATASLDAGDWPYRILVGTASSKDASDPQVAAGSLRWSGTAEVLPNATAPPDATAIQTAAAAALTAYDPPTKAELDSAVSPLATSTALATVDNNVDAILVDTAVIGAAGAGLTAIPWNASWDAEVESAVENVIINSLPEGETKIAASGECAAALTDAKVLKADTAYDITTTNGTLTTTFET